MGSIVDGQPVNASVTNTAKLDKQTDDTAFGIITLANTAPASGPTISNTQGAINNLLTATGNADTTYNDPHSPKIVNNGDTYRQAISEILNKLGPTTAAPPIAATSSAGTQASNYAKEDHTHEGLHSISVFGDSTLIKGDAVLQQGTGITLTRTGSIISITASGGGGGGGGVSLTTQGNLDTKLRPLAFSWFLQSPDTTLWAITVTDTGALVATSGAVGSPSNIYVTKPDTTTASFQIDNTGVISVVSPAAGGTTNNDSAYIISPAGKAWKLTVNNSNVIVMDHTDAENTFARFTNDAGQTLWEVQQVNGLALEYLPVYTLATLPNPPPSVSGCLPQTIFDSGSFKRPAYYDGTHWRYTHDNSIIV